MRNTKHVLNEKSSREVENLYSVEMKQKSNVPNTQ